MKYLIIILFTLFSSFQLSAQQNEQFQGLIADFTREYKELNIPALNLSYVDNINAIGTETDVLIQKDFFKQYLMDLVKINPFMLTEAERSDYFQLQYEIGVNWERLNMEQVFVEGNGKEGLPETGIHDVALGELWYTYFLKKWLSIEITPEEVMAFGTMEVEKVKLEIERIQKELGYEGNEDGFYAHLNEKQFFMSSEEQILSKFEEKQQELKNNLASQFYDYKVPNPEIKVAPENGLGDVPGYYNSSERTFYFSIFNGKYNTRKMDWLYIHEAIPGHHFQAEIASNLPTRTDYHSLFNYPAYAEGWAAYCEELGKEIGLYQTPYDYFGKLEWDLIRSVRVVLDVGINYYGWTDEEALQFWQENIRNQDDKALREIKRMKRWPVQVLTYKIGAAKIMELKEKYKNIQGNNYDVREFHDLILKAGPVPLKILERYVLGEYD